MYIYISISIYLSIYLYIYKYEMMKILTCNNQNQPPGCFSTSFQHLCCRFLFEKGLD